MYCALRAADATYTEVSCDTQGALMVLSNVELARMSPLYLDVESALAIGGAMLLSMSVAWLLRMARLSLGGREAESE